MYILVLKPAFNHVLDQLCNLLTAGSGSGANRVQTPFCNTPFMLAPVSKGVTRRLYFLASILAQAIITTLDPQRYLAALSVSRMLFANGGGRVSLALILSFAVILQEMFRVYAPAHSGGHCYYH
jgi:hypothetical protein